MDRIPDEVCIQILAFLTPRPLLQVGLTSRRLYSLAFEKQILWQHFYFSHFVPFEINDSKIVGNKTTTSSPSSPSNNNDDSSNCNCNCNNNYNNNNNSRESIMTMIDWKAICRENYILASRSVSSALLDHKYRHQFLRVFQYPGCTRVMFEKRLWRRNDMMRAMKRNGAQQQHTAPSPLTSNGESESSSSSSSSSSSMVVPEINKMQFVNRDALVQKVLRGINKKYELTLKARRCTREQLITHLTERCVIKYQSSRGMTPVAALAWCRSFVTQCFSDTSTDCYILGLDYNLSNNSSSSSNNNKKKTTTTAASNGDSDEDDDEATEHSEYDEDEDDEQEQEQEQEQQQQQQHQQLCSTSIGGGGGARAFVPSGGRGQYIIDYSGALLADGVHCVVIFLADAD